MPIHYKYPSLKTFLNPFKYLFVYLQVNHNTNTNYNILSISDPLNRFFVHIPT